MKHKIQIALMLLSLSVVFSCSKMNDKHDFYLDSVGLTLQRYFPVKTGFSFAIG